MSAILESHLAEWSPIRAAQCRAADAPIPAPRWQTKDEPTRHERVLAMLVAFEAMSEMLLKELNSDVEGGEWDELADMTHRDLAYASEHATAARIHWESATARGDT